MKKLIATIGIAASLGASAFALSTVMPASASSSLAQQSSDSPPAAGECPGRIGVADVLDGLVQDGTITQEQMDKIVSALKAARETNQENRPQRPMRAPRLRVIQGALQVSADTIGVSVDELKAAVKDGQSVAEVATAHNVDPATVEQAIVDAATAKIDQAVANGHLTEERANFLKDRLPEMADKFVNHEGGRDC